MHYINRIHLTKKSTSQTNKILKITENMEALKIFCYCSEKQMNSLVDHIAEYLTVTDHSSINNIDEEFYDVRLCVDFDVFMDQISIKSAEILNDDWEVLYEDTCVLNSRLRPLIQSYNQSHKQLVRQAMTIRNEYRYW